MSKRPGSAAKLTEAKVASDMAALMKALVDDKVGVCSSWSLKPSDISQYSQKLDKFAEVAGYTDAVDAEIAFYKVVAAYTEVPPVNSSRVSADQMSTPSRDSAQAKVQTSAKAPSSEVRDQGKRADFSTAKVLADQVGAPNRKPSQTKIQALAKAPSSHLMAKGKEAEPSTADALADQLSTPSRKSEQVKGPTTPNISSAQANGKGTQAASVPSAAKLPADRLITKPSSAKGRSPGNVNASTNTTNTTAPSTINMPADKSTTKPSDAESRLPIDVSAPPKSTAVQKLGKGAHAANLASTARVSADRSNAKPSDVKVRTPAIATSANAVGKGNLAVNAPGDKLSTSSRKQNNIRVVGPADASAVGAIDKGKKTVDNSSAVHASPAKSTSKGKQVVNKNSSLASSPEQTKIMPEDIMIFDSQEDIIPDSEDDEAGPTLA